MKESETNGVENNGHGVREKEFHPSHRFDVRSDIICLALFCLPRR
jgi:hypothetical protein